MRYQVFNSRDGTEPVLSALWRWLAALLASRPALCWDWYRLIDTKTGKTLTEWARATRRST
jgi:hypothetical protein